MLDFHCSVPVLRVVQEGGLVVAAAPRPAGPHPPPSGLGPAPGGAEAGEITCHVYHVSRVSCIMCIMCHVSRVSRVSSVTCQPRAACHLSSEVLTVWVMERSVKREVKSSQGILPPVTTLSCQLSAVSCQLSSVSCLAVICLAIICLAV